MDLIIKGKNLDITDSLRDYAEKKLGRVARDVEAEIVDIQLELSVIKNPSVAENQIAEITVHANGAVIRAEERNGNMYAAIDLVADKLERQLRKYHERLRRGRHGQKTAVAVAEAPVEALPETEEGAVRIVRSKVHSVKPLLPEEAAHQMELLGHSFFVFLNQESSQVNVIYRRKDGSFGLIEPA